MRAAARLTCLVVSLLLSTGTTYAGEFFGELVLKPLPDGENMATVNPFGYVDTKGKRWEVPAGYKTNGASIPRALWSIVGSPFTGKYLQAAVVHDQFCDTKYRSWKLTHDVFYEAMIANGVGKKQALIMWAAVYRFGPRWAKDESACWDTCANDDTVIMEDVSIEPIFNRASLDKITEHVSSNNDETLEQLKEYIDGEIYLDAMAGSVAKKPTARLKGYIYLRSMNKTDMYRELTDMAAPINWSQFGTEPNIKEYRYRVVKVAANDNLKVRSGGGITFPTVGSIPANGKNITMVGRCTTPWCKIRYESLEGWVNSSYLGFDSL